MALSLEPLHVNPELVEDAIGILKEEWPSCLAERLRIVETLRCTGLPCSLVLTESREGAAKEVVGHVRIVQTVEDPENRVYIESVTIKKSRRNMGLGRKLHELLEDYAKKCLKVRYIHVSCETQKGADFYIKLEYCPRPNYVPQVAANILRTFAGVRWKGLVIPKEWEYLYEGEEINPANLHNQRFVKDLYQTSTQ